MIFRKKTELLFVLGLSASIAPPPSFLTVDRRDIEPPYQWRCFDSKTIRVHCDERDIDPDYGPLSFFHFTLDDINGRYEYYSRRARPVESCRIQSRDIRKMLKGEKIVCVLADPIGRLDENTLPFQYREWVWDEVLTAKGRTCWFGRFCKDEDEPTRQKQADPIR